MAKLPGLFKRSGTYYLRVMMPKGLRSIYRGQSKLVKSLGTPSSTHAKTVGAQRRAEALLAFSRLRSTGLEPSCLPPLPAAVQQPSVPPPDLRANATQPQSLVSLRDIHHRWTASRQRSADSVSACLRAVQLFEECAGPIALHQITRQHGDTFRAWLLEPARNTEAKTARDRLTWLKSLLKYTAQDLEALPRQPWEGLDITFSDCPKRRPWTAAELDKFFNRPLFQRGELPTDRRAGKHAAYWIPLLGLFTGARVGELAQLRVRDVILTEVPQSTV